MFTPSLFKDQVAVVTGGGTGIGLAIAQRLGELGARVAIGSRNSENLERGTAELRHAGLDPLAVQLDVRKPEQVDEMVDARASGTSAGSTSWSTTPPATSSARPRTCRRTAGTPSSASCSTAASTARARSAAT